MIRAQGSSLVCLDYLGFHRRQTKEGSVGLCLPLIFRFPLALPSLTSRLIFPSLFPLSFLLFSFIIRRYSSMIYPVQKHLHSLQTSLQPTTRIHPPPISLT
ncbi:Efflux pump rdc3 [Fusarium oxysporum f. sp. albedinis]|nr:Efflux pump rdc3 [Fusarium oxysporum f. sp. albedinis]